MEQRVTRRQTRGSLKEAEQARLRELQRDTLLDEDIKMLEHNPDLDPASNLLEKADPLSEALTGNDVQMHVDLQDSTNTVVPGTSKTPRRLATPRQQDPSIKVVIHSNSPLQTANRMGKTETQGDAGDFDADESQTGALKVVFNQVGQKQQSQTNSSTHQQPESDRERLTRRRLQQPSSAQKLSQAKLDREFLNLIKQSSGNDFGEITQTSKLLSMPSGHKQLVTQRSIPQGAASGKKSLVKQQASEGLCLQTIQSAETAPQKRGGKRTSTIISIGNQNSVITAQGTAALQINANPSKSVGPIMISPSKSHKGSTAAARKGTGADDSNNATEIKVRARSRQHSDIKMIDAKQDASPVAPFDGPRINIIKSSAPIETGGNKSQSASAKASKSRQALASARKALGASTTPNKDIVKTPEKSKPGAFQIRISASSLKDRGDEQSPSRTKNDKSRNPSQMQTPCEDGQPASSKVTLFAPNIPNDVSKSMAGGAIQDGQIAVQDQITSLGQDGQMQQTSMDGVPQDADMLAMQVNEQHTGQTISNADALKSFLLGMQRISMLEKDEPVERKAAGLDKKINQKENGEKNKKGKKEDKSGDKSSKLPEPATVEGSEHVIDQRQLAIDLYLMNSQYQYMKLSQHENVSQDLLLNGPLIHRAFYSILRSDQAIFSMYPQNHYQNAQQFPLDNFPDNNMNIFQQQRQVAQLLTLPPQTLLEQGISPDELRNFLQQTQHLNWQPSPEYTQILQELQAKLQLNPSQMQDLLILMITQGLQPREALFQLIQLDQVQQQNLQSQMQSQIDPKVMDSMLENPIVVYKQTLQMQRQVIQIMDQILMFVNLPSQLLAKHSITLEQLKILPLLQNEGIQPEYLDSVRLQLFQKQQELQIVTNDEQNLLEKLNQLPEEQKRVQLQEQIEYFYGLNHMAEQFRKLLHEIQIQIINVSPREFLEQLTLLQQKHEIHQNQQFDTLMADMPNPPQQPQPQANPLALGQQSNSEAETAIINNQQLLACLKELQSLQDQIAESKSLMNSSKNEPGQDSQNQHDQEQAKNQEIYDHQQQLLRQLLSHRQSIQRYIDQAADDKDIKVAVGGGNQGDVDGEKVGVGEKEVEGKDALQEQGVIAPKSPASPKQLSGIDPDQLSYKLKIYQSQLQEKQKETQLALNSLPSVDVIRQELRDLSQEKVQNPESKPLDQEMRQQSDKKPALQLRDVEGQIQGEEDDLKGGPGKNGPKQGELPTVGMEDDLLTKYLNAKQMAKLAEIMKFFETLSDDQVVQFHLKLINGRMGVIRDKNTTESEKIQAQRAILMYLANLDKFDINKMELELQLNDPQQAQMQHKPSDAITTQTAPQAANGTTQNQSKMQEQALLQQLSQFTQNNGFQMTTEQQLRQLKPQEQQELLSQFQLSQMNQPTLNLQPLDQQFQESLLYQLQQQQANPALQHQNSLESQTSNPLAAFQDSAAAAANDPNMQALLLQHMQQSQSSGQPQQTTAEETLLLEQLKKISKEQEMVQSILHDKENFSALITQGKEQLIKVLEHIQQLNQNQKQIELHLQNIRAQRETNLLTSLQQQIQATSALQDQQSQTNQSAAQQSVNYQLQIQQLLQQQFNQAGSEQAKQELLQAILQNQQHLASQNSATPGALFQQQASAAAALQTAAPQIPADSSSQQQQQLYLEGLLNLLSQQMQTEQQHDPQSQQIQPGDHAALLNQPTTSKRNQTHLQIAHLIQRDKASERQQQLHLQQQQQEAQAPSHSN